MKTWKVKLIKCTRCGTYRFRTFMFKNRDTFDKTCSKCGNRTFKTIKTFRYHEPLNGQLIPYK